MLSRQGTSATPMVCTSLRWPALERRTEKQVSRDSSRLDTTAIHHFRTSLQIFEGFEFENNDHIIFPFV
jgi:hypothetical protein